jgi:hypothetical protein
MKGKLALQESHPDRHQRLPTTGGVHEGIILGVRPPQDQPHSLLMPEEEERSRGLGG